MLLSSKTDHGLEGGTKEESRKSLGNTLYISSWSTDHVC